MSALASPASGAQMLSEPFKWATGTRLFLAAMIASVGARADLGLLGLNGEAGRFLALGGTAALGGVFILFTLTGSPPSRGIQRRGVWVVLAFVVLQLVQAMRAPASIELIRALCDIVAVVAVVLLLQRYGNGARVFVRSLLLASSLGILLGLIGYLAVGATYGSSQRAFGLYTHPNSFAQLANLAIIAGWVGLRSLRQRIALTSIAMLAIALTGSRAHVGAAVIFLLFAIVGADLKQVQRLVAVALLALFGGIAVANSSAIERVGGSQVADLNARDDLWSASMLLIQDEPIIGHGYRQTDTAFTSLLHGGIIDFDKGSSHSFFIQTQLELGIVATALIAVLLVMLIRARSAWPPYGWWYAGALISITVTQVFSSSASIPLGTIRIAYIGIVLMALNPQWATRSYRPRSRGEVHGQDGLVRTTLR